MSEKENPLSTRKKILFWGILLVIVVMVPLLGAIGNYGYKKLNYSFEFGERFGTFDDELGWTLKKNASSYIRGRSYLSGETFFDSLVYTDALGFRAQNPGTQPTPGGIVAIGDSWTFGYCVNYEETYPYFLEELSNTPVTNLGIPAYGSGSTYGLINRHVEKLQPKLVVFLTNALWTRSISTVYPSPEPNLSLIPYFYYDEKMDRGGIKFPAPGVVSKSVEEGIYPGGSLTAGYNTFNYLRYVKFPQIWSLARSYFPKFQSPTSSQTNQEDENFKVNKILEYEVELYGDLSAKHQFQFLIVDFHQTKGYSLAVEKFNKEHPDRKIMYIGHKEFEEKVFTKGINIGLSPEQIRVPMDGHFGSGTNKLIAEMIMDKIRPLGIVSE
jgi:hypothetical protein